MAVEPPDDGHMDEGGGEEVEVADAAQRCAVLW